MDLIQNAWFFKQSAHTRIRNSSTAFYLESKNMLSSYNYFSSQAAALGYPFAHLVHMAYDAYNLVRGIALLAISAFQFKGYAVLAIVEGLAVQCTALILDTLNCALSTLSIISRTLHTCILGYSSGSDYGNNEQRETIVHDENVFGGHDINLSPSTKSTDEPIYEHTYSF